MFERLTLRGPAGALLWGSDDAATLGAWVVRKQRRAWSLRATVERVDTFRVQQVPLYFAARQVQRPFRYWLFPIVPNSVRLAGRALTATLTAPEG